MDIRQIISDEMERQGITQMALAEMTGITRPRINAWLNGHRGINADTLILILEALNMEIRPKAKKRKR